MLTKEWILEHWFTVASVVIYLIANVLPRPHGGDDAGALAAFWRLLDRLCFLTARGLPGSLKPFLASSQEVLPASVSSTCVQAAASNCATSVEPSQGSRKLDEVSLTRADVRSQGAAVESGASEDDIPDSGPVLAGPAPVKKTAAKRRASVAKAEKQPQTAARQKTQAKTKRKGGEQ